MFQVLTVCTGNICRSVLAQGLLRRDLPGDLFRVSSAGIMAVPHGQVPPQQLEIASELGVHGLEEHQTRLTDLDMVYESDLILAMSRKHRQKIVQLDPTASRRTFTIREFARLAPLVTPDDVEAQLEAESGSPLHAAISAVAQKRGLLPPPQSSSELDVIDPFRQSKAIYKQSRDELVPAAQVTADFLKAICSMFDVTSHETATAHHYSIQSDEAGSADIVPFPSRAVVRRQEAKRRGDRSRRLFVPRRSKIAVGEAL